MFLLEFFKSIEKPIKKFFLFSLFDLSVACVGVLVYGILTKTYGPIWVRNQYFGLWLTSVLVFYAIQSLYVEVKKWQSKAYFYVDLGFFLASVTLQLLLTIFYGLAHKIDAIIWSIYLFAVNLTNLYILFARRSNIKSSLDAEREPETVSRMIDQPKSRINEDSKVKSVIFIIIRVSNIVLMVLFIIIQCLLLNGAIIHGAGRLKYPARGNFMDIRLDNATDRTIKVHYLCDGPANNSKPVFLFEGSASHGLADYLNLQILLKEQNRRSCIWDKPGLGYSDYVYTNIKTFQSFYHNLITSLGEQGPFEFVGWGGGGPFLYEYASKYPEMFKSLTFLDVSPANIEFKIKAELNNWTDSQTESYKQGEFAKRKSIFGLINGLGVPWGLMSIFTPPPQTYFANLLNEIQWYFLTEKTWTTQEYFLPSVFSEEDVFNTTKIDMNIPINIIMTKKSDQQIIDQVCTKNGFDKDSAQCRNEIESNKISVRERSKLKDLSKTGKLVNCEYDDCDLGYYVAKGANFTVNTLLSF